MKVAYWTEESACTQFSTPFLIIFQHRWKGKNTDLFVSWETMWAFETWKPEKRELGWTMLGEQSLSHSVFSALKKIRSSQCCAVNNFTCEQHAGLDVKCQHIIEIISESHRMHNWWIISKMYILHFLLT